MTIEWVEVYFSLGSLKEIYKLSIRVYVFGICKLISRACEGGIELFRDKHS
jgi:hypothetical protein